MGQPPGNLRGNFQHHPGLPVCMGGRMLRAMIHGRVANGEARGRPVGSLARAENAGTDWMNMKTSHNSGFTLLEIMLVVSIIGLLVAIAVPNFIRARSLSQATNCISNLRQIRQGIGQWALETKAGATSPVQFSDIQPYLRGSVICPAGGTSFADSYDITDVQTPPTCKKVPTGPNAHREPPDVTQ
jgi:prepilin-type N-terminal cleavage/methylation domain-containing protein